MLSRKRANRLGRNDPCSCGSGKKVKKCCGDDAQRIADEQSERRMLDEMQKIVNAERDRQRRYGMVRPILTVRNDEHRFVAVGSRLYFHKRWRNFTDFLIFYCQDVMGENWWRDELTKQPNDRNPLVRW